MEFRNRLGQVGAVTGISGRCIWRVNDKTSVRCALRLGTTGIDVEVGSSRRISDLSTAGLGVAVGLFVRLPPLCTPWIITYCYLVIATRVDVWQSSFSRCYVLKIRLSYKISCFQSKTSEAVT